MFAENPTQPTSGFTLIELLVAITVFSLLMTALLGGLRFGARVWETNNLRIEQDSPMLATRNFLRRRLEEAIPVVDTTERGPALIGEHESLQFASSMPISIGDGVFTVDLFLQTDLGTDPDLDKNLLIRWQPWPQTSNGEALERVILTDIADMKVTYFGEHEDERGQPRTWHDTWKGVRLPELVRIDITFPPDDGRDWIPLIVSPMVDDWYNTGIW